MRELSLFSGAGGGLLGSYLLGWRPVGYVEQNDYCQRVIAARITDGILPDAPIFGDVRSFIRDGYATSYQGMVDVITAGFPCQPFSLAGKRKGGSDKRNLWPATIQCIRLVRPRYALLENVPGLLVHRYFGTILRTLAESGYSASWRVLSAAECGAPHLRKRLWIVAYDASDRRSWHRNIAAESCEARIGNDLDAGRSSFNGPDTQESGLENWGSTGLSSNESQTNGKAPLAGSERCDSAWWSSEPHLGRVANGIPARMDRLTALGNGQVPAVVRAAWSLLYPIDRNR